MTESKRDMPDLAGLMENAFMMGIGFMEMTREKVGGLTDELIERGKMSQSEARRMAEHMTEAAGKQQKMVRDMVAEETRRAMDTTGLATCEELADIREQIAEIKALLMTQRPSAPGPGE